MDFLEIAQYVEAAFNVLLIVGALLGAWMWKQGRGYFAEKGSAISPDKVTIQVQDAITAAVEKVDARLAEREHRMREDMTSTVGRIDNGAMQRHDELCRELKRMAKDTAEALERADRALSVATEASHRADIANLKVEGVEKVIDGRLKHIETLLSRRFADKEA